MTEKEGFTPEEEPMAIIVMADGTWCSVRAVTMTIITQKQHTQLCDGEIEPKDLVNVLDIYFPTYFHRFREED